MQCVKEDEVSAAAFHAPEMDREVACLQCFLDKLFFQCYENVRKSLEMCDIVTDNNGFVEMKSTGSTPPGRYSTCCLPDLDLNMFKAEHFNIIFQL